MSGGARFKILPRSRPSPAGEEITEMRFGIDVIAVELGLPFLLTLFVLFSDGSSRRIDDNNLELDRHLAPVRGLPHRPGMLHVYVLRYCPFASLCHTRRRVLEAPLSQERPFPVDEHPSRSRRSSYDA